MTTTTEIVKAKRGDLVMVEVRPSYTTSSYGREEITEYRLMMVTNLTRTGEIKMVRNVAWGDDSAPVKLEGMLYTTGRRWLLPKTAWNVEAAVRVAREHVYPNSTTPRAFQSLESARELLEPARIGYVAPAPEPAPSAIPALDDRNNHLKCNHGLADTIGYVVAYSHVNGNDVTFTDIVYVEGANQYSQALGLVRAARAKVAAGQVDAAYAVIHHVYTGGHRYA